MLEQIESDREKAAGLDVRRKVMLSYAIKLTQTPGQMKKTDVDSLKEVGFEDLDVLHLAEIVGYYAYVNRIADGLGVQLEADRESS